VSSPRTSIVVPTLESPSLPSTLEALIGEVGRRSDVELIVAGLDVAGRHRAFPGVRYVQTDGPKYPGAARNAGAAGARGTRLLFVDADCVPLPGWLARMEARLAREPCAVGGGVRFAPEPYWSRVDNVALFHEFLDSRPPSRRRYLASLNFGVDRALFERAGGFDGALRSAEDLDLTVRLWRAGVPLYFEPEAAVLHRPARRSWRGLWRHHFVYGANSARVRLRHADALAAPALLRSRTAMAALGPAIALWTTGRIFLLEGVPRADWPTAPGVFLAKLAWCWSVAGR
jgi:GT2 family glycosyltransferase